MEVKHAYREVSKCMVVVGSLEIYRVEDFFLFLILLIQFEV